MGVSVSRAFELCYVLIFSVAAGLVCGFSVFPRQKPPELRRLFFCVAAQNDGSSQISILYLVSWRTIVLHPV